MPQLGFAEFFPEPVEELRASAAPAAAAGGGPRLLRRRGKLTPPPAATGAGGGDGAPSTTTPSSGTGWHGVDSTARTAARCGSASGCERSRRGRIIGPPPAALPLDCRLLPGRDAADTNGGVTADPAVFAAPGVLAGAPSAAAAMGPERRSPVRIAAVVAQADWDAASRPRARAAVSCVSPLESMYLPVEVSSSRSPRSVLTCRVSMWGRGYYTRMQGTHVHNATLRHSVSSPSGAGLWFTGWVTGYQTVA